MSRNYRADGRSPRQQVGLAAETLAAFQALATVRGQSLSRVISEWVDEQCEPVLRQVQAEVSAQARKEALRASIASGAPTTAAAAAAPSPQAPTSLGVTSLPQDERGAYRKGTALDRAQAEIDGMPEAYLQAFPRMGGESTLDYADRLDGEWDAWSWAQYPTGHTTGRTSSAAPNPQRVAKVWTVGEPEPYNVVIDPTAPLEIEDPRVTALRAEIVDSWPATPDNASDEEHMANVQARKAAVDAHLIANGFKP
jgi:hypothetical protein